MPVVGADMYGGTISTEGSLHDSDGRDRWRSSHRTEHAMHRRVGPDDVPVHDLDQANVGVEEQRVIRASVVAGMLRLRFAFNLIDQRIRRPSEDSSHRRSHCKVFL